MKTPTKGERQKPLTPAWPEFPRLPSSMAASREARAYDESVQSMWRDFRSQLDRLRVDGRNFTVNNITGIGGSSSTGGSGATALNLDSATQAIRLLEAQLGDAYASIFELNEVIVTEDTALARSLRQLTARVAANQAQITQELTAYATREYAEAKATQALTAATAAASAQLTSTLTAYATRTFAEAKKSEAIVAAAGDAQSRVDIETSARASADGTLAARHSVYLNVGGKVAGLRIDGSGSNLTGNISTSFAILADVFKVFNGTSDVAPFAVEADIVYLRNAIAEVLKANISIETPTIIGGQLKFQGDCQIVSTTADGADTSIIRMNGGGGNGQTRGGQVDVLGNEYTTVPGNEGSVLLTPGSAANGAVRLRDRTGTDRLIVTPGGDVEISGGLDATSITASSGILAASYDTPSSRRIKSRIRTIRNPMGLVRSMRGVRFDWKNKALRNDIGFIAEEMAAVLPAVVRRSGRGAVVGMDYTRIPAVLVEALKDMDRRLARMERVAL